MRQLLVSAFVLAACHGAPVHDPADTARISALEQRVAILEAQLQSLAHPQTMTEAPVAAEPRAVATPTPTPPAAGRWAGPDPAKTYAVPLDDSPIVGVSNAPVTIVAALQFPEPFTHRVMPTLLQLRGIYRREVRVVIKLFVVHPRMTASSIAACAAAYQGAIDAMELEIWNAAQDQTLSPTPTGMRGLDEVELRELARGLRLDLKQYDEDFALCKAGLARDTPVLGKLGQHGVPGFWINGRPLSGAQPLESFSKVVDEELAKWKIDDAHGGRLATYYDRITANAPTSP